MRLRYSLLAMIFCVFGMLFAAPAYAVTAGTRDYNYATHQMTFYSGGAWYGFALNVTLGAACTREGSMDFNNTFTVYQICNGTNWVKTVGIPTAATCTRKAALQFSAGTYLVCNGVVWTNIKGSIVAS